MGNLKSTQGLIFLLLNLGTWLISLACPNCPYPTPPFKPPNLPPKYPPKVKPPVVKPQPTVPKPPPHVPKPLIGKPPHISKPTQYFSWGYHDAFPHIPPYVQPPRIPRRPIVHPPIRPKLSIFTTVPITPIPPITPTPPVITPPPPPLETPFLPIIPIPPITPAPPVITPPPLPSVVPLPPPETLSPPPPPPKTPCSPPPPPPPETCPTLKLDKCVDELGRLAHVEIGSKAKDTCCPVLAGLLDLDAALCLCTTIKAKLFNINIVTPSALQVLVDCGKALPSGFQCPA